LAVLGDVAQLSRTTDGQDGNDWGYALPLRNEVSMLEIRSCA